MSDQTVDTNVPPVNNSTTLEEERLQNKKNEQAVEKSMEALQGQGIASIDMLMDITLQLTVELGRTQMTVRQVLDIQKGSVVELNRIAGDAVDIYVNDHLFAHGEVVVVDDKFGVRISDLVSPAHELSEA